MIDCEFEEEIDGKTYRAELIADSDQPGAEVTVYCNGTSRRGIRGALTVDRFARLLLVEIVRSQSLGGAGTARR